ncbi:MAG: hypothetical protein PHO28_03235 [Candidatus Pacebacteria bacterium]|nr:hypothetical protein [Candidatus Paceibacterota bacterium]
MNNVNFGVNIDKIIEINVVEPVIFKEFSANIIPATVSAFGFDLQKSTDSFSQIDWFMLLKLINASNNGLIVENIQAECVGRSGYRCKSNNFLTQIYRATGKNESDIIENLLNDNIHIKELLSLPFLLKAESETIIRVDFSLKIYKKLFFQLRPIVFNRQEIKEPETYQDLLQKAIIAIQINRNPKPLLIKL